MRVLTNEAAVLLMLGEGPSSGVGVMERLRDAWPSGRAIGAGALYPLLRRLEKAGLVRRWVEVERSGVGRPRRFLELTARGVDEVGRLREELLLAGGGLAQAYLPFTASRMRANLRRAFRVSAFATRLRDARTER